MKRQKHLNVIGALCLGAASLAACGGSQGGSKDSFTFSYYDGGFGSDWIKAVVDDYTTNVNPEVSIELKRSVDNDTSRTKIMSGVGTYDLYQIEVGMFNCSDYLVDLSDLLDYDVYGESGVKVQDKIAADQLSYYDEDGHTYQLPQTSMTGWNWVYNKDTLDSAFGAGQYSLPKTTDEFFTFGDSLYDKGVYLTAFPGGDTKGGDYTRYAYETWYAQMTGSSGFDHYFNGEYQKEDGTWALAEDSPRNIAQNKTAMVEAYKVTEKLCTHAAGQSQYMHERSNILQYKDVDVLLYGGKYKGQTLPSIAFHYVGEWLENEIAPSIESGTVSNHEVLPMKMPVISSIISRTPTIQDDAALSKVVDYVDGALSSKPTGVSDDDIAIIKEARNMVPELICREFVIPKSASHIDLIKNFLAYLTSDRAQKIAAKACRGISVLPYGYEPTDEDMGFTISNFVKTFQSIAKEANIVDIGNLNKPFAGFMNLNWCKDALGSISKGIFTGEGISSSEIYDQTYNYYSSTWTTMIAQYKAKYGIQ